MRWLTLKKYFSDMVTSGRKVRPRLLIDKFGKSFLVQLKTNEAEPFDVNPASFSVDRTRLNDSLL
jgi:hypothetical protein